METTNVPIKVNYSNGSNLTPNQQLLFKNLEWGIGFEDSTMYLSYEIDQDQLYAVMTRFDGFVKHNPTQDNNLEELFEDGVEDTEEYNIKDGLIRNKIELNEFKYFFLVKKIQENKNKALFHNAIPLIVSKLKIGEIE